MFQHLNCTRWAAIPITDRMTDRNTNRLPYAFAVNANRGIMNVFPLSITTASANRHVRCAHCQVGSNRGAVKGSWISASVHLFVYACVMLRNVRSTSFSAQAYSQILTISGHELLFISLDFMVQNEDLQKGMTQQWRTILAIMIPYFCRWHVCNYLLLFSYVYIKTAFCKWLRAMCWLHIAQWLPTFIWSPVMANYVCKSP